MADPELPAFVTLDEVARVSGLEPKVARRLMKRRGAWRRIGNEYRVDTTVLARVETGIYQLLVKRRVRQSMAIEDS